MVNRDLKNGQPNGDNQPISSHTLLRAFPFLCLFFFFLFFADALFLSLSLPQIFEAIILSLATYV